MKILYLALLIATCTLSACYHEDDLTPSANETVGRFDFPQGTNSWDRDAEKIAGEFGVQLIYTNFSEEELNRTWVGSSLTGSPILADTLNDDQADFAISFMKDHIFAHLNPDLLPRVFPTYILLAYNITRYVEIIPGWGWTSTLKTVKGMDFWAYCFEAKTTISRPQTPEQYWKLRYDLLRDISQLILDRGNIEVAPKLITDLDYETPYLVTSGYKDDPNYYKKRGFPGRSDRGWDPWDEVTSNNPKLIFMYYIHLAMYNTRETIVQENTDYPKVIELYDYVVDYLKTNYDWDVAKIAER